MTERMMKKHVAVVPFPFTSHPMALVEHAVRLAEAAPNVQFSFINIPSSNASIFHSKHHLIPTNLKAYDIIAPPSGQNLEEESEWYYTNAPHSYEAVIEAAEVETGVSVSCLLTDFLTASASEIATKMGVKWIAFWSASQLSLLAHVHTSAITDHLVIGGRFDPKSEFMKKKIDFVPGLSMMRVEDLPAHIFESISGSTVPVVKVLAEIGTVLPKVDAVVINCFAEETLTEPASVLRSKVKTLLQIGFPLTKWGQRNLDDDIDSDSDSDQSRCLSWLDQQNHRPKSVVYVSFGTMPLLSPEEISGIAMAFEKTKTPFLWSIKDRIHLPTGFIERTSSYGKLVAWAPQTLVLAHPSVGAFITHAGFNSMMESVIGEVPMIIRPIWADQMLNARVAEEVWQSGVEVEGRVITFNGMIKCLEMVLGEQQGKWMRHKIKVLKGVIADATASNGSATKDFNSLVDLISSN